MGSVMQNMKYKCLRRFGIVLTLFTLFFSCYVSAVVNNALPSKNDIQNKLNTLSKKSSQSTEDKLSIIDIEKALVFYDEQAKLDEKSEEL